jgi:hypothetical protein
MFIIANHNIQDPDAFWALVKEKSSEIPSHLKLHGVYPSTNSLRSVCLWEAQSTDAVNQFLRQAFGDLSRDELFEVNATVAMGLPKMVETA